MSQEIVVRAPTEAEKKSMAKWPVWEKEESEFDWEYDSTETCLIIEGEVTVTPNGGDPVSFKAGDVVIFPEGLACTWKITKAVRKHYNFA